jgi:hypothetical protein
MVEAAGEISAKLGWRAPADIEEPV